MENKIIFSDSNANWTKDRDYNRMFIRSTEIYINDLLKWRGYVYLNDIYENFCTKWDPKRENPCILYEETKTIKFSVEELVENTFEITITW